jgi:hypothetical protein
VSGIAVDTDYIIAEKLAAATGATGDKQCEGQAHTCRANKRWTW